MHPLCQRPTRTHSCFAHVSTTHLLLSNGTNYIIGVLPCPSIL